MIEKTYGLHSAFDIENHKATFTNYLEVVIDADGRIMYAVPSHQEKLIALACAKLHVTRDELKSMCPNKYYCDFMRWLCLLTGAMSVWDDRCECGNPTSKQLAALRKLKLAGLYRGPSQTFQKIPPRPASKTSAEARKKSKETPKNSKNPFSKLWNRSTDSRAKKAPYNPIQNLK